MMHLEKGRWDDRSVRLWCPCSEPHHLPLQVLLHTVPQLWVGGQSLRRGKGSHWSLSLFPSKSNQILADFSHSSFQPPYITQFP